MQTVLITGGTGMIGSALALFLQEEGYRIIVLTRKTGNFERKDGIRYAKWDPRNNEMDMEALGEADHIVHLAGANIGRGKWTREKKKEIRDSRITGTRFLMELLSRFPNKVISFISASATGYYRPNEDLFLKEMDAASGDFLGEVCASWEAEAQRMATLGKRVVILRTGIVLSATGGMLPALVQPLKLGIAAVPGTGQQWISWIHIRDLVRLYATAVNNIHLNGIINAVTPFPVTQLQLVTHLAHVIKGKYYLPFYCPAFFLRLFMGEKGAELLKSSKVSAEKLLQTGFEFSFPTVEGAMEDLYGRK
ncbi:MAG: TIGR01777 family protein [Chitinophagaceae bacterium]|nr:MAG: TIGR01777 family protein [Chitinophagaceae bacterium]